jgi:hypothetical protein
VSEQTASTGAPATDSTGSAGTATIVVRRDRHRGGWIRTLQVHLDDEPAGALTRTRALALPVRPGVHRVWTGRTWRRTDRLELAVDEGTEVHLRVSTPRGHGGAVTEVLRGRSSPWRLRPDASARGHVRRRWIWAGRRPRAWAALFALGVLVALGGIALALRSPWVGIAAAGCGIGAATLAVVRAVDELHWRPIPARSGPA